MSRWPDPIGPYLALEARTGGSKRVSRYLFVDMYSLRMLPEIVETGEAAQTVTLKGPFPSMFPVASISDQSYQAPLRAC